ncbi:MAG: PIG-L family deacetylase [Lentisphaerae bacterium]|nr:PIG-L family deacetylase [Lentisphaerota bacterium]
MMNKRKIMAVGAHADDIELNVGGTLAKYHAAGYEVVYVMSTNNFSGGWSTLGPDGKKVSRHPPHHELMPQRKLEAAAAAKHFGAVPVHLDHPQRHYNDDAGKRLELRYGCELPRDLPADIPTILTAYEDKPSIKRLAGLILEHCPEAVLTHGVAAGNVEHFATCLLVAQAYHQAVAAGHRGLLLQWLELGITAHGPLNYVWNSFVDISDYTEAKLAAVAEHACQIPDVSTLDLPEWGPACGCRQAEVFMVVAGLQPPGPHQAFSLEIMRNSR